MKRHTSVGSAGTSTSHASSTQSGGAGAGAMSIDSDNASGTGGGAVDMTMMMMMMMDGGGTYDNMITDEAALKRQRRLERNKIAARECRKRKKEQMEKLEHEIRLYEAENLSLRIQIRDATEQQQQHMNGRRKVAGAGGEDGLDAAVDESHKKQQHIVDEINELLNHYKQKQSNSEGSGDKDSKKKKKKSGGSSYKNDNEDEDAGDRRIIQVLEKYKDDHADYGRSSRSAIDYHLQQVERLLQLTPTTAVLMATNLGKRMELAKHFTSEQYPSLGIHWKVDNPEDEKELWKSYIEHLYAKYPGSKPDGTLTEEEILELDPFRNVDPNDPCPHVDPVALADFCNLYMGVTPQQANFFHDSEVTVRYLDESIPYIRSTLQALRECFQTTGEDIENEFDGIHAILTPTQSAKLLLWVYQNKAAVHLLDELWKHAFPVDQMAAATRPASSTITPSATAATAATTSNNMQSNTPK